VNDLSSLRHSHVVIAGPAAMTRVGEAAMVVIFRCGCLARTSHFYYAILEIEDER
jgi:hypothetical protein